MPVLLTEQKPGLAVLQVDRPEVRNALDWQAMQSFADCVRQIQSSANMRVLVITGTAQAFIAGGDLKVLANYPDHADGQRLSRLMGLALAQLERLPCISIAAMNGPARGGGTEIALACDMRVMSEDADFGLVQVSLGLTPGWGGGQRLARLVGYSRSLEWLALGTVLSARQSLEAGLVNRLCTPGQALSSALDLGDQILAQPVDVVYAIKRLLRASLVLPAQLAAANEQAEFPALWAADAHQQAVKRFVERRNG